MQITFGPRGILQIDDARIIYKNFSGAPSKFNREGDRNFSVLIPERDLTPDEVDSILDIYRDAEMVQTEDGPVLSYRGNDIITLNDALRAFGWNVKSKPPREDGEDPFRHLPVKVSFNERGPAVYLESGRAVNQLRESEVDILDNIDILSVSLDIRPYDWEVQGKTGRTAYLQSIHVTQRVDRFKERFQERI